MMILVVTSTAGAQQFEGVVTYQMGSNGDSWLYQAKGSKVRIDMTSPKMPSGGMSAILDMGAMTTTVLMSTQHVYMTMPMPQNVPMSDSVHGKITKTGSEVIAGVPCDDYVGTDAKGEKQGMACVARGMGNFLQYSSSNPIMRQWASHMSGLNSALGNGGFPLKWVKSNGETTMLATKVERKSLDASLFSVPAGYTQMQMPAGMPQH